MLQAILESAVAAILAIDSSGRISSANPAAEKM
ncbi:MAG: PAS domain-containing protein, partial [Hyphomicrobium sp.]